MSPSPDHARSLPRRPLVTTRTHEAFTLALRLAERHGHDDVNAVHVALGVLGVLEEGRNVAVAALHMRGIPLEVLQRELEAQLPPAGPPRAQAALSWTPGIEHALERAITESRELGNEFYGCEHVLLGLVRDPASAPAQVLAGHGLGYDDARRAVLQVHNGGPETGPA